MSCWLACSKGKNTQKRHKSESFLRKKDNCKIQDSVLNKKDQTNQTQTKIQTDQAEQKPNTIPDKLYEESKQLFSEGELARKDNNTSKWLQIMEKLTNSKYQGEYKHKGITQQSEFYYYVKNYAESKKFLYMAIEDPLSSNKEHYYNMLGLCYLKSNQLQLAIQKFKECVLINPNFSEAHNNQGNIYMKMNCIKKAMIHYEKAKVSTNYYNQIILTNNQAIAFIKRDDLKNCQKCLEELSLLTTPDINMHLIIIKNGFDMFFEDGLINIIKILLDSNTNNETLEISEEHIYQANYTIESKELSEKITNSKVAKSDHQDLGKISEICNDFSEDSFDDDQYDNINDVNEFDSFDGWDNVDLMDNFLKVAEKSLQDLFGKNSENVVVGFFLGKVYELMKNTVEAYRYYNSVLNMKFLGKIKGKAVYGYFADKAKVLIEGILDEDLVESDKGGVNSVYQKDYCFI